MTTTISTAARNAACDAIVDLLDVGSADANGDLVIQTSGDVEVATLALSNPAFGDAVGGVATANTISDDPWMNQIDIGTTIENWYSGNCGAEVGTSVNKNGICSGAPLQVWLAPMRQDVNDVDSDSDTAEYFSRKPIAVMGTGGLSLFMPEDHDTDYYGPFNIYMPNNAPDGGRTPAKSNALMYSVSNHGWRSEGWGFQGNVAEWPYFETTVYWNSLLWIQSDLPTNKAAATLESVNVSSDTSNKDADQVSGNDGVLDGDWAPILNMRDRSNAGSCDPDSDGTGEYPCGQVAFKFTNASRMHLAAVCDDNDAGDGCEDDLTESQVIVWHGTSVGSCQSEGDDGDTDWEDGTGVACVDDSDCPHGEICTPGDDTGNQYYTDSAATYTKLGAEDATGVNFIELPDLAGEDGIVQVDRGRWGNFVQAWQPYSMDAAGGAAPFGAGFMRLYELYLPVAVRFDQVTIFTHNASTATTPDCTLCFYGDASSSGVVDQLVCSSTEDAHTDWGINAAAENDIAFTETTIGPGVVYYGMTCDDVTGWQVRYIEMRAGAVTEMKLARTGNISVTPGSEPSTIDLSSQSWSLQVSPWIHLEDTSGGTK